MKNEQGWLNITQLTLSETHRLALAEMLRLVGERKMNHSAVALGILKKMADTAQSMPKELRKDADFLVWSGLIAGAMFQEGEAIVPLLKTIDAAIKAGKNAKDPQVQREGTDDSSSKGSSGGSGADASTGRSAERDVSERCTCPLCDKVGRLSHYR